MLPPCWVHVRPRQLLCTHHRQRHYRKQPKLGGKGGVRRRWRKRGPNQCATVRVHNTGLRPLYMCLVRFVLPYFLRTIVAHTTRRYGLYQAL